MALRDPRVSKSEMIDTTGNIVLVRVGTDPVSCYSIHENTLCATSDFFKAAVKKEWKSVLSRAVDLSDEDAGTFQVYATWLYSRRLAINEKDETGAQNWLALTNLYLLGEKLLDGKFKDTVTDAMLAAVRRSAHGPEAFRPAQYYYPGFEIIKTLYEGTAKGSKARRLFAEIYAGHIQTSTLLQYQDFYPYDFLLELAQVLMHRRPSNLSGEFRHANEPCRYHEHDESLRGRCFAV